jgi:hypothetical protein
MGVKLSKISSLCSPKQHYQDSLRSSRRPEIDKKASKPDQNDREKLIVTKNYQEDTSIAHKHMGWVSTAESLHFPPDQFCQVITFKENTEYTSLPLLWNNVTLTFESFQESKSLDRVVSNRQAESGPNGQSQNLFPSQPNRFSERPGIWEIESLFNFLLGAGCYLEDHWEYFPNLSMKTIFVPSRDGHGDNNSNLKLENPYLTPEYMQVQVQEFWPILLHLQGDKRKKHDKQKKNYSKEEIQYKYAQILNNYDANQISNLVSNKFKQSREVRLALFDNEFGQESKVGFTQNDVPIDLKNFPYRKKLAELMTYHESMIRENVKSMFFIILQYFLNYNDETFLAQIYKDHSLTEMKPSTEILQFFHYAVQEFDHAFPNHYLAMIIESHLLDIASTINMDQSYDGHSRRESPLSECMPTFIE